MKYRVVMTAVAVFFVAAILVSVPSVSALEYHFDGVSPPEYYDSTDYESIYGTRYVHGANNVINFEIPSPTYGLSSHLSVVASPQYSISTTQSILYEYQQRSVKYIDTAEMHRDDGSIGTVNIPSLGISYMLYEGETTESMSKGLGHFSSTSGWDGNVGICGHNRGAKYAIGGIKDMEVGDTIIYQTVYGTRYYSVETVAVVSETDLSYLQPTTDNYITLITCIAGRPGYRVCVQAKEVS